MTDQFISSIPDLEECYPIQVIKVLVNKEQYTDITIETYCREEHGKLTNSFVLSEIIFLFCASRHK